MVRKLVRNPYIVIRQNTYYFRYTVPTSIRKLHHSFPTEIKRSLKTDSYLKANEYASKKLSLIQSLKKATKLSEVQRLICDIGDFSYLQSLIENDLEYNLGTQSTIRIDDLWEHYVASRSWADKQLKANQRMFSNLRLFINNIDVTDIHKKDILEALHGISKLPKRNIKQYKNIPLKLLLKLKISEQDRISSKYVREHLKLYQSFFHSYLVEEKLLLEVAPTTGIRWKFENKRFGCFTNEQIRVLIVNLKRKPEWFKWFVFLSLYSGARRSEIASLKRSDIKWCNETKRYYFIVREGKTKAARRIVPIHKELINAGLLEWVDQFEERIFKVAFQNLNRVTDLFNSILDDKTSLNGERLVFHSLRHTFITKARSVGNLNALVQQVVGHEKSGAGVTDRYTHTFELADIAKVIDSVVY
jgi:integrase